MCARDGGGGEDRPGGEPGRSLSLPRRRKKPASHATRASLPPLDVPAPEVPVPSVAELERIPGGPALALIVATLGADEAVFDAWAQTAADGAADPEHPDLVTLSRANARVTLLQAAARVAAWAAGMESALTWAAHQDVYTAAGGSASEQHG